MHLSSPAGTSRPFRRAAAAIALLVFCALALVPASSFAAPAVTPKATAAALTTELRVLTGRKVALQRAVRRCGARRCVAKRARLARVSARAARLRSLLRKRRAPRPPVRQQPIKDANGPTSTTATPKPSASTATTTTTTPSTGTSTTPAPATTNPGSVAAGAPVTFQPGVVVYQSPTYDIPAAQRLGARRVRMEFDAATPASGLADAVGNYAAQGIQLVLLAGFPARLPTDQDARNVAAWAAAYGPGGSFWQGRNDGDKAVQLIEWGNETSMNWQYGDTVDSPSFVTRAKTYALKFRDAAQGIAAANRNVGLLAQADDWSGKWTDAVYSAVPNFHEYVSGWVTHPYGNDWRETIRRDKANLARHGAPSTIPWDATEWGLASTGGKCLNDNYGWDPCMNYDAAASVMRQTIADLRAELGGRLRSLMFYRVRDLKNPGATNEREDFFGLQTIDLKDKGALTAQARVELAAG